MEQDKTSKAQDAAPTRGQHGLARALADAEKANSILREKIRSLTRERDLLLDNEKADAEEKMALRDKASALQFHPNLKLGLNIALARKKWGWLPGLLAGAWLHHRQWRPGRIAHSATDGPGEKRIRKIRKRFPPVSNFQKPDTEVIRVAAIMDAGMVKNWAPECEIAELAPETALATLGALQPQLLLVESPASGPWRQHLFEMTRPVKKLIHHCRQHTIPIVFWFTLAPDAYPALLPFAAACDFVFTPELDLIPRFRADLASERVYLLPFATQPALHNPLWPKGTGGAQDLFFTAEASRTTGAPLPCENKAHCRLKMAANQGFASVNCPYPQSQTWVTPRVFELTGSNLTPVSSFSRALRNFYGDLAISTNHPPELERRFRQLDDPEFGPRARLAALRQTLERHTYGQRLNYIKEKIWGLSAPAPIRVGLTGVAASEADLAAILASFKRQNWETCELWLISPDGMAKLPLDARVHRVSSLKAAQAAMSQCDLVGQLSPDHFYGANYVRDLALGRVFGSYAAYGKGDHFIWENGRPQLREGIGAYKAATLKPWSSLSVNTPDSPFWTSLPGGGDLPGLALDEFNFIAEGSHIEEVHLKRALDLDILNKGIDYRSKLEPFAETVTQARPKSIFVSGKCLCQNLVAPPGITLRPEGEALLVQSSLAAGEHKNCASRLFSRQQLNLVNNNEIAFNTGDNDRLTLVLHFLDANGARVGSASLKSGRHLLIIPHPCSHIQILLRMEGPGTALLPGLAFGPPEEIDAIACRSETLVIAKRYPAHDAPYNYAFIHGRVKNYPRAGFLPDVFITQPGKTRFYEIDNVDVATGELAALRATLASGQIGIVAIHLLYPALWRTVRDFAGKVKFIFWMHGADCLHWRRRVFGPVRPGARKYQGKARASQELLAMWREILELSAGSFHFVFVSETLRGECEEDLGRVFPEEHVSIIHNYIDGEEFPYIPKEADQRFRVLSIRPFSSLKYANDLTVDAILELARRPGFERFQFSIIGEGPLYEETVTPLKGLHNVRLERRFLNREEMRREYQRHGVLLTPTRSDTQGVARDEAMAAGLVPVTCDVEAIGEFVDESCGILTPPEDSIALADALEKLARDPALFQRMSKNAALRPRTQSGFGNTIKREIALVEKKQESPHQVILSCGKRHQISTDQTYNFWSSLLST